MKECDEYRVKYLRMDCSVLEAERERIVKGISLALAIPWPSSCISIRLSEQLPPL